VPSLPRSSQSGCLLEPHRLFEPGFLPLTEEGLDALCAAVKPGRSRMDRSRVILPFWSAVRAFPSSSANWKIGCSSLDFGEE
jgi:hypothetical protein